jgi:hypothetical protein
VGLLKTLYLHSQNGKLVGGSMYDELVFYIYNSLQFKWVRTESAKVVLWILRHINYTPYSNPRIPTICRMIQQNCTFNFVREPFIPGGSQMNVSRSRSTQPTSICTHRVPLSLCHPVLLNSTIGEWIWIFRGWCTINLTRSPHRFITP